MNSQKNILSRFNKTDIARQLGISRSTVNSYSAMQGAPQADKWGRIDLEDFKAFFYARSPRASERLVPARAATSPIADPDDPMRLFNFSNTDEHTRGCMRIAVQWFTDGILEALLLDAAAPVLAHRSPKKVLNTLRWVLHYSRAMSDAEFGEMPIEAVYPSQDPGRCADIDRKWAETRMKTIALVAAIGKREDAEKGK